MLYVVATPIGNLQDMSPRAVATLAAAQLVAAEDTRVARRLFAALGIVRPARLISAREHNEQQAADAIIAALAVGDVVALLCDAGTPAISDPGGRVARRARAAGFDVSPIPGACAFAALASVAGLSDAPLHFFGFPPATAAKRRRLFDSLQTQEGYSFFYESPRRIAATLGDLAATLGGAQRVVLGRELTKLHEQIFDSDLTGVTYALATGEIPARGEFSLAVQNPAYGGGTAAAGDGWRVFCELAPHLPPRRAAAIAAKLTGADARELYQRSVGSRQ